MSARQRVLIDIWIAYQLPMEHSNVQQYLCYELIFLQVQDTNFLQKLMIKQQEMYDACILSEHPSVYRRADTE